MVKAKYYILTGALIGLGLLMAFLPEKPMSKQISADQILAEINYDTRFWSTDRVARTIIQEDPLLLLVDVRTPVEYAKYHLPGAINVPLKDITSEDWLSYFDQDVKEIVFYSNGTIYASQAWMLLRRMSFPNLYVLEGGLNNWVETIMRPKAPKRSASIQEVELYQFRKGASAFFGGGTVGSATDTQATQPTPVIKKRRKKGAVEGGC